MACEVVRAQSIICFTVFVEILYYYLVIVLVGLFERVKMYKYGQKENVLQHT